MNDLAHAPATELGALLVKCEVRSVELVQMYLDRIERWNGRLNAYITVTAEQALEAARRADEVIAGSGPVGLLHGLPVAIKDQFSTAGIRTTCGSASLANHVPDVDATVVTRLNAEGAVLLGKLSMSPFALGDAASFPYGRPTNPWNQRHDAGGSSTGGAIAVAAGLCAAAIGEDTGGSIRNPASLNGVVGLRPTWGRVSRYGIWPLAWSLDVAGPMSRTVEDAALLLGAISGHDPKDPFTARLPVPDYTAMLDRELRGTRVGIVREIVHGELISPEVQSAVLAAAAQLEGLGAQLEEVSIPLLPLAGMLFVALTDAEAAVRHREGLSGSPEDFEQAQRRRMLAASLLPTTLYHKVQQGRNLIREQIREACRRYDVLLSAPTPLPAARIATTPRPVGSKSDVVHLFEQRSFMSSFALAGTPAMSLPCGFSSTGLPLGLQLAAGPFQEPTLLAVAHAYERSTPWHDRVPALDEQAGSGGG